MFLQWYDKGNPCYSSPYPPEGETKYNIKCAINHIVVIVVQFLFLPYQSLTILLH